MTSSSTRASSRTVLLARHGRTAHNAAGRFQGRLDVPLDEQGRREAAALAEVAAGHDLATIVSSPLARARQTAGMVGDRLGLPVQLDERWAEIDVGDWTGRTYAEVGEDVVLAFRGFAHVPPGGETFDAVQARVLAALADAPPRALVISHGMALRLLLRALRRETPLLANAQLLSVEQPAPRRA